MGEAANAGTGNDDTAASRRRFDRKILIAFVVLAGLFAALSATLNLSTGDADLYDMASSALSGLSLAFLAVGLPSYLRYGRRGLTPRRRVLLWIAAISAVITAITLASIALANVYAPELVQLDAVSAGGLLVAAVAITIVSYLIFFCVCIVALVTAFGVVGVLSALERSFTTWALRRVANLSSTREGSLVGRAIRWLFDIPDILDTRTLSIRPPEPRRRVSISDLRSPVLWQLVFGLVLGVYISFNPFVSDRSPSTLLRLFSLLTAGCMLFPFIVLPWFLLKRIGAGISGQTREFTLFNGIRARVFQSYLAVGTIVLLLRLSIQEIAVALETFLLAFSAFMVTLLVSASVFTFVYLNYFEDVLTKDIVDGLRGTEVRVISEGAEVESGPAEPPQAEHVA